MFKVLTVFEVFFNIEFILFKIKLYFMKLVEYE